jgi:hypothetical protein
MKNTTNPAEQEFCEVFSEYTGEKIDNPRRLTECRMTGEGLFNFVDFHFWQIYSKKLSESNRKTDDTIFRLKAVIIALIFLMIMLVLSKY